MRNVVYNILKVVELVLNLPIIAVFLVGMSIFSSLCQYVHSFEEGYSHWFKMLNNYTGYTVLIVILISAVVCTVKMLVANLGVSNVGLIKSLLPVGVSLILYVVTPSIASFIFSALKTNMPYSNSTVVYLVMFWVCVIVIAVKKMVGSSEGVKVKTELSGSNDVALKYFDGSLKDVSLKDAEVIALKYIGGEDYE